MIKQLKTLVLATTVGVSVASCSKQPTACFTVDPSTAQVGESITLDASCSAEVQDEKYIWSDNSNGASSYSAASSSIQTVTFDTPGTYTINLKVENGKKSDNTEQTITIQ